MATAAMTASLPPGGDAEPTTAPHDAAKHNGNGNGHAASTHAAAAAGAMSTTTHADNTLPLPLPAPRAPFSTSPTATTQRYAPAAASRLHELIAPSDSDSAGAAAMNVNLRRGLGIDQPTAAASLAQNDAAPSLSPSSSPLAPTGSSPAKASLPVPPVPVPIPAPLRRLSIDRRVRSEVLPKPRRHSSMANGRRPSVLTGGFESSSDDEKNNNGHGDVVGSLAPSNRSTGRPVIGLPMLQEAQAHHHAAASGRRRAQSLMSPPAAHDAVAPGGGGGGGAAFAPPSPAGSRRASRMQRPYTGSPLSPRGPSAAAGVGGAASTATGSPRFAPTSAGLGQEPSWRVTAPSGGEATSSGWEDDMVRQRPRKLRSVDENKPQDHQPQEQHHKPSPLTLSLGLGSLRNEAVLSSDQIQALLQDADVSSAIQLMSNAPPSSRAHRQSIIAPSPDVSHSATTQPPTSSTTVELPPVSKPYLVSAPPALTSGGADWGGRDRSPSISSTVAPSPMRNVTPATTGRRRALSNATLGGDSDGGHIPFTHHVPPIPAGDTDIEEASEGDIGHSDNPTSAHFSANEGGLSTPKTPDMSAVPPKAKDDSGSRRRISGFFNRGKKRASSPNQAPPERLERLAPPASSPAPTPARRHVETQALRQKMDRDAEMKNAERARRQQEQLQEQQYRARLTVNAHPAAQRKALAASTHLDAYYSAINEGLENPPKFDPLAVLRWKHATEAQTDKRIKWETEHAADLERLHASRALSPLPWNAAASKTSLGSSPMIGSSPRYEALRPSFDTRRSRTTAPNGEPLIAPGWHYTMDDVNEYNECKGAIDYFYPPVLPPIPDTQEAHPSPGPPESNGSAVWSGHRSQHSITSSQDERKPKDAGLPLNHTHHGASSSVQSLIGPGNTSEDGGTAALSRTNSIEAASTVRPRPASSSFRTHRAHQSTSGIPSQKSMSILRSPLESLKTAAKDVRRNIAGAVADFDDAEVAPADVNGQNRPYIHHHNSFKDRANMLRRNIGSGNAHTGGEASTGTSEDEHGNLRRLFGRGVVSGGVARMASNLGPRKANNVDAETHAAVSRAAELREWENVYAREQRAKERQAKRERQATEMELAAAARIAQVEDEIYAERLGILGKARNRLEQADIANTKMDYTVAHFTDQLDQVQAVFRHTADIDVSFPGLSALKKPPTRSASKDEDETADSLGPLVAESDKGYFSAVGSGSNRPRPQRKPAAAPQVTLPSFGLGVLGPRRSVLDPITGTNVDPIGRLQLTLDRGRDVKSGFAKGRADAAQQLRDINTTIDSLIKQKESVRSWIKHLLPRIGKLKEERANIAVKIKGGVNARMWRSSDIAVDLFVRWAMGLVSYFIRIARGINWVRRVEVGWFLWSCLGVVAAMLVFFFVTGDSPNGAPVSATMSASLSEMASASDMPSASVSAL